MTYAEIAAEVVNRGAQNNTGRLSLFINAAYKKIVNGDDWPFTLADATGSAGAGFVALTSSTFRKIILVTDVQSSTPGRPLTRTTLDELVDYGDVDATLTGTPDLWYYDAVAAQVKAFPVGGTVKVRYHQRVADLSGANAPVFHADYHYIVVKQAVVYVYEDRDNLQAAATLQSDVDRDLAAMREDYQINARDHLFIATLVTPEV